MRVPDIAAQWQTPIGGLDQESRKSFAGNVLKTIAFRKSQQSGLDTSLGILPFSVTFGIAGKSEIHVHRYKFRQIDENGRFHHGSTVSATIALCSNLTIQGRLQML